MVDYNKLIDAGTWEFIRRTEVWYPPDTVARTVTERRAIYNAMCRAFFSGYPDGVNARDIDADGVTVRLYQCGGTRAGAAVLYLHGGGFVVGGLESHDDICAEICAATGLDVVAVDYRLLPEHEYPQIYADGACALAWVQKQLAKPVVLVGDSAGGGLAAALAHAGRGRRDILGQVLIYPGLGGDVNRGSYLSHANAPLLSRDEVLYYAARRGENVGFSPLQSTDFSGLPPTLALSAQCDPLSDDARDYAAAINAAGGQAVWVLNEGLVHGHLRARHSVARARESFEHVLHTIGQMAAGAPISGSSV
ncbi:MAG: alpha/beta hydrolase fold domain-containing protein [Paracoccaceae bacterium]